MTIIAIGFAVFVILAALGLRGLDQWFKEWD